MTESYDLTKLDPNTFEHLVNLLALRVLGPDTLVSGQEQMRVAMVISRVKLLTQAKLIDGLVNGILNRNFINPIYQKTHKHG